MFSRLPLLVLVALLSMVGGGCTQPDPILQARQGHLVVSANSLAQRGAVRLDGQWQFFWQRYVEPTDTSDTLQPDTLLALPGVWAGQHLHGRPLPGQGYASYRLLLRLQGLQGRTLRLQSPEFFTAYRVWVGGRLVAQSGHPSTNAQGTRAALVPLYTSFTPNEADQQLSVVLHIANYHHDKGGVWDPIVLGYDHSLERRYLQTNRTTVFLIGFIGVMALYYLLMFLLLPDRSLVYFGVSAGFMIVRLLLTNERLIYELWPGVPFELVYSAEYITGYFTVVPIFLFFRSLFPREFPLPVVYVFLTTGLVGMLFVAVAPTTVDSNYVWAYMLYTMLAGLYSVFYGLPMAVYRRHKAAKLAYLGVVVFMLSGINDMARATGQYHGPYLLPAGLAILVFFQAGTLAIRLAHFYKTNQQLSLELNYKNQHLEKLVAERTTQISEKNEELRQRNDEISAQRDAAHREHQRLSQSIRYAEKIQRAILPPAELLQFYFADHFVLYKPRDIVSGDFYWWRQQSDYLYLAVVDCTGHGVPGAFMSMLGFAYLSDIVAKYQSPDTDSILNELRELVKQALRQENHRNSHNDGMNLALCRLHLPTRTLQFSGSQSSLLHLRGGHCNELRGDRMPISIYPNERNFGVQTLALQPGDRLYLYSDGYKDQLGGPDAHRLGHQRFVQLIGQLHQLPMAQQHQLLVEHHLAWRANLAQVDDMLLMGLQI